MAVLASPSFPVEIWEAIFHNVTGSGDLYSICLVSRYFRNISMPILYGQLFLDQNPYLAFTIARLLHDPGLMDRVSTITLLHTVPRTPPLDIHMEADSLCKQLNIRCLPSPHSIQSPSSQISDEQNNQRPDTDVWAPNMIYFFPKVFANLTTLNIRGGILPAHFLSYIFNLPQLASLHLRYSLVPLNLESAIPPKPLLLRELSIKGCRTTSERASLNVPAILAEGLLLNSPHITSLTVDLFLEFVVCALLPTLENPPAICTLNCQGLSHNDADCALMCSVLTALPTITTLHMARTPRELSMFLPSTCLPSLRNLTGQIKSLVVFTFLRRPLEYLTITDAASPSGGISWENHLIMFLESLEGICDGLKGLAFNVAEWSEEVFLCVCHLCPHLKELSIQCTSGKGVDEYFRISFGPRFLPKFRSLEVLHIFEKSLKHGFTKCRMSKGVVVHSESPAAIASLDADELDEVVETPFHLRRWEKLNPNLKEVAFDREAWWRRLEPGGWILRRDPLDVLAEE